MYADAVNSVLNLQDEVLPALFIAIGYSDKNFAVNQFRSGREDVETLITRHA